MLQLRDSPKTPVRLFREPNGFCPRARHRPKALRESPAREQMAADMPRLFACWSGRAHSLTESQHRRDARSVADGQPTSTKKRDWWRLDPNVSHKYKPVEPPAVPDPDLRPTRDRIVFGWEAPMSDLEWAVQEHLQKEHPELYMRLVHLALIHGGLIDDDGSGGVPEPHDATASADSDKAA